MARVATPPWVTELAAQVLREHAPRRRGLVVDWRTRGRVKRNPRMRVAQFSIRVGEFSHGQGDLERTVTVWAGQHEFDQRMVLLHELAHWLTGGLHTPEFWNMAWRLYMRHLPRRYWHYALEHETSYRAQALHAAARAGVPGAREMVESRRARSAAKRAKKAAAVR